MMNLTLRQLRYFDALARMGHFGRAAAVCSVSQPALSVQIKELETELGAPLFERGARQVRLTSVGEELQARVTDILQSVDDLGEVARAAQGRLAGSLRLGVIPTIAPYLLPRLIREVSARHAGLELHLRETLTGRLINELLDRSLDAAVVALPVSEPSLTEVPLFDEEFVLVRPEHEADLPVPDAEALRAMRLLLLEEGHCFRDQALDFCAARPPLPRETLDGSSLTTLVQMVGAGMGVTLVPEMAVPVETRLAGVSVARFPSDRPRRTIGMIWRRSSAIAGLLEEVAETVRRAGTEGPEPHT